MCRESEEGEITISFLSRIKILNTRPGLGTRTYSGTNWNGRLKCCLLIQR